MSFFKDSPGGNQTQRDLESGSPNSRSADFDGEDYSSDPFEISRTKNASVQRLKRWRVCANSLTFLLLLSFFCFLQKWQLDTQPQLTHRET